MPDYSHCTATMKCWEQIDRFNGEERIMTQQIIHTFAKLREMTAAAGSIPTLDEAIDIEHAAREITTLIGRQWRQMIREPYNFPKPEDPISQSKARRTTIEDLLV